MIGGLGLSHLLALPYGFWSKLVELDEGLCFFSSFFHSYQWKNGFFPELRGVLDKMTPYPLSSLL